MSDYDVVISGGTVLDGTGAPPVAGNIGITDGVIAQVSDQPLRGQQRIDADGQVVAPGFIDLHSHADFRLPGWPAASTQLPQGVTTLLVGNCGFSPFPVADLQQMKSATAFLDPELNWDWQDHRGFTRAVAESRPAINMATQVGHHALRSAVLGGAERLAGPAELAQMADLLADAAGSGTQGFSTGLIYAPGTYSDEREVQHLVSAAARAGLLYSTHIRNEGAALTDAVREAIRVAEAAGARLQISHLKAAGPANHGTVGLALDLIDEAAERGVDVAADVYPYTASSTTLTTRLPAWAMDGGPQGLLARLAEPARRATLLAELRAEERPSTPASGVMIADIGPGRYADTAGQSLAEIARAEGIDAAEATLRILAEHEGAVSVVLHSMAAEDVAQVVAHPRVAIASDGWVMRPQGSGQPHPRSFGTFPRVLAHYVRDRGVLSLTEAVRKMTSLPASRLGWSDRGVLHPGAVADVVVFDPQTIADRSTYTDPWQLATGVSEVLVAGQVALRGGQPTGARAGSVLLR